MYYVTARSLPLEYNHAVTQVICVSTHTTTSQHMAVPKNLSPFTTLLGNKTIEL